MIPAARRFTAADLAAARSPSRIRERPPVPYIQPQPPAHPQAHVSTPPTQRSAVHHFTPSRRQRQPPHRRLLFLPKTASFSSPVAFLTPPTFPAPAPRKRFFDPLPKKILGFRTRKGRLPRRQYLARARLEFRAGLRVVVSSRVRAFGISCGLLAGGAVGWLAALAVDGWRCAAPAGLRGMVSLRGPARLVSPAPARLAALADGWPSCRLPELSAVLPTVCPLCRPPPPSEPPTPTACRRWMICRRDRLPRRSADLPPGRPEPPPRVFTAPGIVPG